MLRRSWFVVAATAFTALLIGGFALVRAGFAIDEDERKHLSKQIAGLKKYQYLIGDWNATSQIVGGKQTGTIETYHWKWHLSRDEPPAMMLRIEDGEFFTSALLRYDPDRKKYRFVAQRILDEQQAKKSKKKTETVVYEGEIKPSEVDPEIELLTMSRRVPRSRSQERVTLRLHEEHHYVFQLDKRNTRKMPFRPRRIFSVTREGKSIATLAEAKSAPDCFISGGLGTMTFAYKGKAYYFCCTGCLESFKDDPERWIAEAKKSKK